jgi:hypothetical protein
MRKSLAACVVCLVCAMAAPAYAAVVGYVSLTNPVINGLPGYVGVVVWIVTDQGNINFFDFGGTNPTHPDDALKGLFFASGFPPSPKIPGIHQRWLVGDDGFGNPVDVPTARNPVTAALVTDPNNRDSYWNSEIAQTATVYFAEEDNPFTGSPLSPTNDPNPGGFKYGLGDEMHYTTGIALAGQRSYVDLAYLVVPEIGFVHITGEVEAGGQKVPVEQSLLFSPPWPRILEPSWAGILCLGLPSLMRRRVRR